MTGSPMFSVNLANRKIQLNQTIICRDPDQTSQFCGISLSCFLLVASHQKTRNDLFSINNVNFGNCISAIYPSELELKDTSTSSTEVCYLDTNIKTGDVTTPFRISIYDKRDDFAFRIVNFPHMDSNILYDY